MLFRLSHKSRSVVNGVPIRLSQSILSPSLTSHLLSCTLHARFGNSFFFEIKKEKSEKLPNGKSDQETCRDSNRGPFALPGECSSDWATSHGPWWMEWVYEPIVPSIMCYECLTVIRVVFCLGLATTGPPSLLTCACSHVWVQVVTRVTTTHVRSLSVDAFLFAQSRVDQTLVKIWHHK